MTYEIILWKSNNHEYLKKDVKFETKTEATAYTQGMYDSLREIVELVGYSVKEK